MTLTHDSCDSVVESADATVVEADVTTGVSLLPCVTETVVERFPVAITDDVVMNVVVIVRPAVDAIMVVEFVNGFSPGTVPEVPKLNTFEEVVDVIPRLVSPGATSALEELPVIVEKPVPCPRVGDVTIVLSEGALTVILAETFVVKATVVILIDVLLFRGSVVPPVLSAVTS